MYLFFDSKGVLKEQILEPLRSGDSGKIIYAYIDETTPSSCSIQYELSDGSYYTPTSAELVGTFEEVEIPYDRKRDLKYFKYDTTYRCLKFVIPDDVLTNVGAESDHTNKGCIGINIYYIASNENKTCKIVPVLVEKTSRSVVATQSITLAQWNEVMKWRREQDDYIAGVGISINEKVISVNDTIARQTDLQPIEQQISNLGENKQDKLTPNQELILNSDVLNEVERLQEQTSTLEGKTDVLWEALTPTLKATAVSANNAFSFNISLNDKGLYLLTYGNTFTLIPVYNLTPNTTYKTSGTFVYDNLGSVVTTTLNMKYDTTLKITSGNSQFQIANGFTGYLFQIKLF